MYPVPLRWQKVPSHVRLCKLSTRDFVVIEYGQAAMPVVQPDTMQAIIGHCPLAFDALHEVKPVEQYQPGNTQALIIALCHFHDRQKVILVQSRSGRTHVRERCD